MIRMLVLSHRLKAEKNWLNTKMKGNVDIFEWGQYPRIPRLSDYEVVVLDMNTPTDITLDNSFIGQREEAQILLESGGVIICLNYFTRRTERKVTRYPKATDLDTSAFFAGSDRRYEINYDWMFNPYLLSVTKLALRNARVGKSFVLESREKMFIEYFKGVSEYHKTIDSVVELEDEKGSFGHHIIYIPNWGEFLVKVIARAKVSQKPIACVMKNTRGSLIFLPQSQADAEIVITQLYMIGKSEFDKNVQRMEQLPLPPEWLERYKTQQELDLEQRIRLLNKKLEERKLEHRRFRKIDVLLYGTGEPLEEAVQKVLEEMGCSVEKQEKGATIDIKAKKASVKLAIEITGVDDKIHKDSRKFSQILQYLPHKEEKEKIILLVNTYRNMNPERRAMKENFTKTVVKIAEDNHFCLMTTKDLYFMWEAFLDGEAPKKLLAQIFSTDGEFVYSRTKNN